jgi:hypothetical protein
MRFKYKKRDPIMTKKTKAQLEQELTLAQDRIRELQDLLIRMANPDVCGDVYDEVTNEENARFDEELERLNEFLLSEEDKGCHPTKTVKVVVQAELPAIPKMVSKKTYDKISKELDESVGYIISDNIRYIDMKEILAYDILDDQLEEVYERALKVVNVDILGDHNVREAIEEVWGEMVYTNSKNTGVEVV